MPTYRHLDRTPRILFLPGDQIIPWAIIIGLCYGIFRKGMGLSWGWVSGLSLWGIATWWTLTWKGMYPYFSQFVKTPRWVRAVIPYQSILQRHAETQIANPQTSRRTNSNIPPL